MRLPRVQFTVRRMMAAVAVASALFGGMVRYHNLARAQRRAVMLTRSHGGGVFYDYVVEAHDKSKETHQDVAPTPWAPKWLSQALGEDYFYNAASVGYYGEGGGWSGRLVKEVRDPQLAALKGMGRLRRLFLRHTSVTDAGLDHLKDLAHLEVLWIHGIDVTEAKVAELGKSLPRLKITRGCSCELCRQAGCDRATRCAVGSDQGPPPPPAAPSRSG